VTTFNFAGSIARPFGEMTHPQNCTVYMWNTHVFDSYIAHYCTMFEEWCEPAECILGCVGLGESSSFQSNKIIQVSTQEIIQVPLEYVVYKMLDGGRCICQIKMHDQEFI
jgi:hypothetical protein